MHDTKNILLSKTVWGVVLTLVAVFLPKLGYSLDEATGAGFVDEIVVLLTAAFAIYGRVKAVTRVTA